MASVQTVNDIIANVEKVIVGKTDAIEKTIITLICDGHVLIEDVPGVGKTGLATAVARSINASFKRIQFTPDVLPSDITGFSIYNQKQNEFEFKPGAIMSSFVLADEINRTSPKTQASLLEAMEENQVTVDGVTYQLSKPFMVLATQNPIEFIGTYPLPEAQIDRFFMKITIGYPSRDEERDILQRYQLNNPLTSLDPVASMSDIIEIQQAVKEIHMESSLNGYIVDIIGKTRSHSDVILGASIRGSMALYRAAQAKAYISGRDYCLPDDIMSMVYPVLSHRIMLKQEARLKRVTTLQILEEIISTTKVPV